jgi:pimeloyl-ACP methyl ester carboxylesterase
MAKAFPKTAKKDLPDLRDRMYEPALIDLEKEIAPPSLTAHEILDQGQEGACTGFALAAAINLLSRRSEGNLRASARMLYEMAKLYDEWEGETYEGSSLRGAIRGWHNNGVTSEGSWPFALGKPGRLTIKRAKEARSNTVGAYYRVRPVVSDYHTALNEAGVIVVSAQVHSGWNNARKKIPFRKRTEGGHAFAVVGYNDEGFWVQNSWGPGWGNGGLALWSYEDWARNVMDAWVVRLALPTPQIFGSPTPSATSNDESIAKKPKIPRAEIAGHFAHIEDGGFKSSGRYWSSADDVKQTAELVGDSSKYDHLLFYAHGGLNAPESSARRVRALRDGYKRNRIYPFHFMYDTGLAEELKDLIFNKGSAASERVGGFTDWLDRRTESVARPLGTRLWDEMKIDADRAFANQTAAGTKSARLFLDALEDADQKKKIHLVGHSTGAVLIAHMLRALRNEDVKIESCTLLAPACTIELYDSHYVPVLRGRENLKLGRLDVLNLSDRLERNDNVAMVYRKSLLYLVSNAFERWHKEPREIREGFSGRPLLGMEVFKDSVDGARGKTKLIFSNGVRGGTTRSQTHGGFDNDLRTMNYVLKRILGRTAREPFREEELDY